MTATSSSTTWNLLCLFPLLVLGGVLGSQSLPVHPPPQVVSLLVWPMGLVCLFMLLFLGGFRYEAHAPGLTISLGLLRLPIKSLPWSDVVEISVVPGVDPLRDFRGLGWRSNRRTRTTGYVVMSGDAVAVRTAEWTYLLVMPNPTAFADAARRMLGRASSPAAHHA